MDNIIRLTEENGEKTDFKLLDLIEYSDEEHVILVQCDDLKCRRGSRLSGPKK